MNRRALACLPLLALTALTGCAAGEESLLDRGTLRIGVQSDQPLVAFENADGELEGFDIDAAAYIADYLGKDVEWVRITTAEREQVLLDGDADLVIASFSVTQERKQRIDFAGPYAIAHQDLLVRADETAISSISDIGGRNLCVTEGSNVDERITIEHGVQAVPIPARDATDCLDLLVAGDVDVVATDDRILAGLAWQSDGRAKLVGAGYSEERLGVGLQSGDTAGCEAVNRAITAMHADGTAELLMRQWFAQTGMDVDTIPIPQFEGCES
jgi:glutamate transport system substrate-binding protein